MTVEEADAEGDRDEGQFMQLLTKEQVLHCYRQYYEATSKASLSFFICAVCACEQ